MLRPPQPAVYLFLLDVSSLAQQSGYLDVACQTIFEQLDNLPGDARTQVGFIAFNSAVHFYSIAEGYNQPHEITVLEVDGIELIDRAHLKCQLDYNLKSLHCFHRCFSPMS